ncbi:hypothetical protein BT69DRAFT_1107823 [Atractiella rhizophila]|nr:hypothetical protein BT69DRAFT_1107823 [Atractiella rhizophila]
MGYRRKPQKEKQESLFDILNSAPPWERDPSPARPGPMQAGVASSGPGEREKPSSRKLQKMSGEGRSSFGHNRALPGTGSFSANPSKLTFDEKTTFGSRDDLSVSTAAMNRNKSQPNLRGAFADDKVARGNYNTESTKDLADFFNSVPPPPAARTNTVLSDELGGKGGDGRNATEEEEAAFRGTSSPNFGAAHTGHQMAMGGTAGLNRKGSKGGGVGISSDDIKRMRGTGGGSSISLDQPFPSNSTSTSSPRIDFPPARGTSSLPKSASAANASKLVAASANGVSDFSALNPSSSSMNTSQPRPSFQKPASGMSTDTITSSDSFKTARGSSDMITSSQGQRKIFAEPGSGLHIQTPLHSTDSLTSNGAQSSVSPPDTPQQSTMRGNRPLYLPTKVEQNYRDNPNAHKRRSNSHLSGRSMTPVSSIPEHADANYLRERGPGARSSPSSPNVRGGGLRPSSAGSSGDTSEMEVVLNALKNLQRQFEGAESVAECKEALDSTILKLVSEAAGTPVRWRSS